jgi:hypothetical protein
VTRIGLTAGVLALWLLGVWGMWRGWRGRAARTALPDLPVAPEVPGADVVEPLIGLYLGTTDGSGWLARVAAARLGERSGGWLRVLPTGVLIRRPSYDDLFIPADALDWVRMDSAHAGRVIGPGGVLVICWRHAGRTLETGFRGDDKSRHVQAHDAMSQLVQSPAAHHVKESQ